MNKASDKQINFINSLLSESDKDPLDYLDLEVMTSKEASALISTLLKEKPVKEKKPYVKSHAEETVPAGRYAIEKDGVLKFYQVDKPEDGKWQGYTFVKVWSSDNKFPVKGAGKYQVLDAIAVDPKHASLAFGKEIGCCGICGRTLTDEDSRAKGIGPICAENVGW